MGYAWGRRGQQLEFALMNENRVPMWVVLWHGMAWHGMASCGWRSCRVLGAVCRLAVLASENELKIASAVKWVWVWVGAEHGLRSVHGS